MPNELEPTVAEIEAMMAAAQDADGHDKYLTAWRAELSADERRRSERNLEAFVAEARASRGPDRTAASSDKSWSTGCHEAGGEPDLR